MRNNDNLEYVEIIIFLYVLVNEWLKGNSFLNNFDYLFHYSL